MITTDTLHLGDCLELMKNIPDNSVDMVLCDLPYGKVACQWDIIIPFEKLWPLYDRVCKENAAIVLFANEPFTSEMILSNIKQYRQKLTWLKTRPTNVFNAKKQFMNWTEDIVVFYKKLPTFNPQYWDDGNNPKVKVQRKQDRSRGILGSSGEHDGYVSVYGGKRYPKSVLEFGSVKNNMKGYHHPTEKPVALLRYLIRTYTNVGGVILDNCMGSGSTCVAAIQERRHFIGIEKEEKYFEIAKERVEATS